MPRGAPNARRWLAALTTALRVATLLLLPFAIPGIGLMVMAAFGSSMVAGVGIALMMLALFTAVIVGVVRPRYGAKVAWGAVGASLSLIALVAILAS